MAGDYDNENPYDNMSQHTTETTTKDGDDIISVKSAAGTKSPIPGKLELGLRNWFCPHSSNYVREIVHAQKNWGCFWEVFIFMEKNITIYKSTFLLQNNFFSRFGCGENESYWGKWITSNQKVPFYKVPSYSNKGATTFFSFWN